MPKTTTIPSKKVLPIKLDVGFYQELKYLSQQTSQPMAEIIRDLIKEPVLHQVKSIRQHNHQSLVEHAAAVAFEGELRKPELNNDELIYGGGE